MDEFLVGRERELSDLVLQPRRLDVTGAPCLGASPDTYHPEEGQPDPIALCRCTGCPVRLACLALALRIEDPTERSGWYGGYSPEERDLVMVGLGLRTTTPAAPGPAEEAVRLQAAGWKVNDIAEHLGRSRRTVQRYFRSVA